MPRSTRYLQNGFIYHVTHRCHDGRFFLRFSRERDQYREWLRIGALRYGVSVLGYAITSNHVHVVVDVEDRHAVADVMKLAAGVVAQARHRRKGGEDSVWEHPYQCTRIQDGRHLLNCLRYLDLNMVRAGKVEHPRDWRWCGYDELTGKRQRYRIVDQERLLGRTGFSAMSEFCGFYADSIERVLSEGRPERQAWWTEAVAVGSEEFIENAAKTCSYRRSMSKQAIPIPGQESTWIVREAPVAYSPDLCKESDLQAVRRPGP